MKKLDVQWIPDNATAVEITHRESAAKREQIPAKLQAVPHAVSRKVIVITAEGAMLRQCIRAM
jgi:hypothetical protein